MYSHSFMHMSARRDRKRATYLKSLVAVFMPDRRDSNPASGWTLAANVDSELGSGYRSYAGRGTLTYAW